MQLPVTKDLDVTKSKLTETCPDCLDAYLFKSLGSHNIVIAPLSGWSGVAVSSKIKFLICRGFVVWTLECVGVPITALIIILLRMIKFQESETGLYICMNKHYAFGKKYVEGYSSKTGCRAFLHLRRKRKVCRCLVDLHGFTPYFIYMAIERIAANCLTTLSPMVFSRTQWNI